MKGTIAVMTHTECSVQFARHSRRIAAGNQVGWLYDDQRRAAASALRQGPGRLSRLLAQLRPTHRPAAAASH